ncbi:MAG: glycoside hydrolase family 27 protein [Fidelibacterota bacterium]
MKQSLLFILSLIFIISCTADDVASTPPMGWMTWNQFTGDISDQLIRETADAMVETGMKDAGYEYIIIDDLWQGERDEKDVLHPDYEKFPHGMKALADYVHSRGLKLGIYSDAAEYTCAGAIGSYGYEEIDAQTFADWGMDYLKYDYCGAPAHRDSAIVRYKTMGDALEKTGRPILYAICEWGPRKPWEWAASVGGNVWRTTWDIRDTWDHGQYDSGHNGIINCLDRNVDLWKYAKPGHWNDMDMLLAGLNGTGKASGSIGCSNQEYQSQMSLWCLLNSPLLASCDIRSMDDETLRILTNKEVIAINQDRLGKQAKRLIKNNDTEIWGKKLHNGDWAVGFLNRNDSETKKMTFKNLDIEMKKNFKSVRDLWKNKVVATDVNKYTCTVKPHEVVLVRLGV